MGKKVRIQLAPGDRLEASIADGDTPQKHVRRAQIVLLAGDGVGTDVRTPDFLRCGHSLWPPTSGHESEWDSVALPLQLPGVLCCRVGTDRPHTPTRSSSGVRARFVG